MQKLIGITCLAVGIVLLLWGYNTAHAINSQFKELFTGSPTNQAVSLYIAGTVLCAIGAFQLIWKGK
jgi:hypothetical protein